MRRGAALPARLVGSSGVISGIRAHSGVQRAQDVISAAKDSPSAEGVDWELAWRKQATPWDMGRPAQPIVDADTAGFIPSGRILVPGCGSGHDCVALAREGRQVVGLDLSPTAVAAAAQLAAGAGLGADKLELQVGDFFTAHEPGSFKGIVDYTFMSALPPAMREQWAARCKELLVPGGALITLMFPLGTFEGGPPFAVTERLYRDLLSRIGFECIYLRAVAPGNTIARSHPARQGRESFGVWRIAPRRTLGAAE